MIRITITDKKIMQLAIERAKQTMNEDLGGPFGAAVIDEQGEVLSVTSNSVLGDHDATAHAEINAIREASKKIRSHDLSGCILYTTAYPCPMCLGAIIWSNIKTIVYGCRPEDTDEIGFRDDFIYKYIEDGCKDTSILEIREDFREDCLKLFREYEALGKEIY